MKNAFTLIELLAIMTLIGIVILVAMPSLIESNRISKTNEISDFKETINSACEAYLAVHTDEYSKDPTQFDKVYAGDLVSEGYLQANLINPETEKTITEENGQVSVTNTSGKITCTYNPGA